ncbi:hypothetical protein RZS08_48240, partial [Arthrospira platensis SPKY1]|nr:hypothetical protein [Arthrospira platensis SPKY1]
MTEPGKPSESALKVNQGIEQPPVINPQAADRYSKPVQAVLDIDTYFNGILQGNRMVLGKAI